MSIGLAVLGTAMWFGALLILDRFLGHLVSMRGNIVSFLPPGIVLLLVYGRAHPRPELRSKLRAVFWLSLTGALLGFLGTVAGPLWLNWASSLVGMSAAIYGLCLAGRLVGQSKTQSPQPSSR